MSVVRRKIADKISLILGLGIFLISFFQAAGQIPSLHRFSVKEGLPQSEVSSLFQDSRGTIWIGTRGGGLVRYDGYGLSTIKNLGNANYQFVNNIVEMPDGRLAIGLTYGGLAYYNNRKFQVCKGNSGVDEWRNLVAIESRVYAIGNSAVSKTSSQGDSMETIFKLPVKNEKVQAVIAIGNRWLLAATDSGLLVMDTKLEARTFFLKIDSDLKNHEVIGINMVDKKKAILLSSTGHMAEIDFESGWGVVGNWEKITSISLGIEEKLKTAWFGVGKNLKWVATTNGKLLQPGGEALDLNLIKDGTIAEISCLLLDKNENLWIGTEGGGIYMKNKSHILNYNNISPLNTNHLKATSRLSDGTLVAGGTKTGLIVLKKSTNGMVHSIKLPGKSIFSILDQPDFLAVGTENSLILLNKKTWVTQKEYFTNSKIVTLNSGPEGCLLVGTYGNGAWYLPTNKPLQRLNKEGQLPLYVYGFEALNENNLLIPSNSGLWALNWPEKSLSIMSTPDSIGNIFFLSTKDKFGTIWFSVPDGLVGYRNNNWYQIRSNEGIGSSLVYTLNADQFGHLWVGTNSGIDRISVNESGNQIGIKNYGPEEGYEGYEANMRAAFLKGNELLIGTIEGLFQIPVGNSELEPVPPKPIITSISIHAKNGYWTDSTWRIQKGWITGPEQGITISGANHGIAFEFKSINPEIVSKLKYSYRLIGSSDDWSTPSKDQKAIFVGLKGSAFSFQARTTYDGKSFSEPVNFSFSIPKVWYQSFLFVAALVVLIVTVLILIFFSILRSIKTETAIQNSTITPERLSQTLLLIAALFHPISYYFSPIAESSHFIVKLIFIINISTVSLLFASTLISSELRKKSFLFLQIVFVLFMFGKASTVYISNLSSYSVVSYLFVGLLAYLVLDKFWKVILFGIFLISFALFCHFDIQYPQYHPVLFTIANLLIFILLMLTLLNRKRHDTRLEFANKVVNTGPVLVLGFKSNFKLVFSSGNIFDLLNYQDFEVKGFNWWSEVVQSKDEIAKMQAKLIEGSNKNFQARLKKKNGSHCIYEFSVRPINQQINVLIGQDVTEAQDLESKFKHLVENAPDCIYQTDFYGTIVYANPQTAFLLGISQEQLIGRQFHEFIREDLRKEVLNFYTHQFRENLSSTYNEYPMVTQRGNVRWLGFQVVMLTRTAEQNIEGYIAIGRDITERLEAEQLIQHQHKNITDSLSYASRIKQALLPDEKALRDSFSEAACINQPKDIIGGDFFWMARSGKKQVFVLGDCTGHGVPGAFMTTIAVGLLRQIIKENFSRNCEDVLTIFNKTLTKLLNSNGDTESTDFVEMAICFIDSETNEMSFISSGIGLHLVKENGEVHSFHNGSRGLNYKIDYKGLSEKINYSERDKFFLFTDGFYDQMGGEKNKRFTRQRMLDLLKDNSKTNLTETVEEIQKQINRWKGDHPQIDDQLLVAFRI